MADRPKPRVEVERTIARLSVVLVRAAQVKVVKYRIVMKLVQPRALSQRYVHHR